MEMFVILTVSRPAGGGFQQLTLVQTVTASPGMTRADLLALMLRQAQSQGVQGGNVMFFSAEPNALALPGPKVVKGR